MKIAYFGTPSFSAQLLEKLISDKSIPADIVFIVTQPDKPVGKKQTATPSPVKVMAQKYHIPVFDNLEQIGPELSRIDLAIVYAYGFKQLIPLDLLKAPKYKMGDTGTGFINLHPSLLPRYRGASPIAFPILLGDKLTGVTLFAMDEKMDHGPVIAQEKLEIALNDVRGIMEQKLTGLGFEMVKKLLITLSDNRTPAAVPQDHTLATHAHYMTKEHGFLPYPSLLKALKNEALMLQELPHILRGYLEKYKSPQEKFLNNSSGTIWNFCRGISPWPGVWTTVTLNDTQRRLKITEMTFVDNMLQIKKVQLDGKKEVDFPTFKKAYGLFP